jgi:cytochrome c oxidase subunit 1
MFTTGQSANNYFALTSTLLLVPAGIEYLGLGATMWRGSIRLTTPMLFALAFAFQFLIGGLTGIMLGAPALDYQLHDSYFVVAHFHYTAFGGALFGAFAAAYYWFPKMTGLVLRDGLGKLHFWLMVLGFNLTFFPQFIAGWAGMPRRVADYPATGLLEGANMASTIGGFVLTVAVLIFIANVILSLMDRRPSVADPGGGFTLEWATSSPPPPLNFTAPLPPITSETPVLDRRIGPPVAEAKP